MGLKFYSDTFPPGTKPERDGEYRTKYKLGVSWWETMYWRNGLWHHYPDLTVPCTTQQVYWRGLGFDPDAALPIHTNSGRKGAFIIGAEVE